MTAYYLLWRVANTPGHQHWTGPFSSGVEALQAAADLPARRDFVAVTMDAGSDDAIEFDGCKCAGCATMSASVTS